MSYHYLHIYVYMLMTPAVDTDTVAMFGIEFITVFTALLLKKRIAVYHSDVTQLLAVSR